LKKFADLFALIDQTQSTNEKVQYMEEYFKKVSSADGAWTLFFLSGHRLKRLVSSRMLLEWCMETTNIPLWLMEESYAAVGDTAETIALLIKSAFNQDNPFDLSLADLMEKVILPLANRNKEDQKESIFTVWKKLNNKEIFIFNKILTGGFRVGVSSLLTLKALSKALNIPREILSQRVMGVWQPTPEFYDSLRNIDQENKYLNPYPFFLASPLEGDLESLGDPQDWQAEWKWDGIRAQVIHRNGQTAIWSRGNELISEQFPEIMEVLNKLPDGTVLDGEILAFKEDLPLSFGELQKRLGRKKPSKNIQLEVPVVFMIYDLLELDHEDYRKQPLRIRQKAFEKFPEIDLIFRLSKSITFDNWEQIREDRLQAKSKLTEGVMLKRLDSAYGIGRQRGNWWKYKVDPMTIDAVLLYAQAGTGRRANLYTDYTFGIWHEKELIPIAKAYSGLTQEEIAKLDHWIRRNTMEKFGPVRKVKAEQVFEIAFEGIQLSNRHKSGIALRFPRIARWRTDKPMEECDTLDQIKLEFFHEQR
jgi:DNA ligase 1